MNNNELTKKLYEIDKIKAEYLSNDRHGSYTADEMYLKLLSAYLRGKNSISLTVLNAFTDRITSQKEYFTSLIVTHEMRISRELQAIERNLEAWNRKLNFVSLPFECPELLEFPHGISRCIEDVASKDDYSLDTLIRVLVNFVTSDSADKYTLYKALFFYLTSASRNKYFEQLEYICKDDSNKVFFRRLFQETAQFISSTTYESDIAKLKARHDNLTSELANMSEKQKKSICMIYIDGIPRNVIM